FVGRTSDEKRPEDIAYACAVLGEQYVPVYVGPQRVKHLAERIVKACPWRVIAGQMDPIGDAYAALDCMALTSPAEGAGLVFLEAMAARCPVVATSVGVIPSLTEEFGEVARVVPNPPKVDE